MTNNRLFIKINNVMKASIVILMTVLALMFAGCKKTVVEAENTNVSEDELQKNDGKSVENDENDKETDADISDAEIVVNIKLEGGSGKTSVTSPSKAVKDGDKYNVSVEFSSSNYDYVIYKDEKYLPVNTDGNSLFILPVDDIDSSIDIIADTVAMSKPHEIQYTLSFSRGELSCDGNQKDAENGDSNSQNTEQVYSSDIADFISSHKITGRTETKYADGFSIISVDDKYSVIEINGSDYYLLKNKGDELPKDLPKEVKVIDGPLSKIYVVSTASYDYLRELNVLDKITYTSFKEDDTADELLKKYMKEGKINYAGKYSAPDYEMLLAGGCDLVIENTMITHKTSVIEKLEELHICPLVEYSSYERTLLGRLEWIKLYGVLTGTSEAAEEIFNKKESELLKEYSKSDKKVAYFYITDGGGVVIRKNQDYVVDLIETAGGKYVFSDNDSYSGTGAMTIQKEIFLEEAKDVDVLIYNSAIIGGIKTKEELKAKCDAISVLKAYKEDNVYCTSENFYTSVMDMPQIVGDLNSILSGKTVSGFINKLE